MILAMTILELGQSVEQEAHEAEVNGGLIQPTKEAPSVKDVIVIDTDDTDNVVTSQEWNIKEKHVDSDKPNTTVVPEVTEVHGAILNEKGQRQSAQLAQNYTDG